VASPYKSKYSPSLYPKQAGRSDLRPAAYSAVLDFFRGPGAGLYRGVVQGVMGASDGVKARSAYLSGVNALFQSDEFKGTVGALLTPDGLSSMEQVGKAYARKEWDFLSKVYHDKDKIGEKLAERIENYVQSGESMGWQMALSQLPTDSLIYWELGVAEHCPDCVALSASSPFAPKELPTVPRAGGTVCLMNCRCALRIVYEGEEINHPKYPTEGRALTAFGDPPDAIIEAHELGNRIMRARAGMHLEPDKRAEWIKERRRLTMELIKVTRENDLRVAWHQGAGEYRDSLQALISNNYNLHTSGELAAGSTVLLPGRGPNFVATVEGSTGSYATVNHFGRKLRVRFDQETVMESPHLDPETGLPTLAPTSKGSGLSAQLAKTTSDKILIDPTFSAGDRKVLRQRLGIELSYLPLSLVREVNAMRGEFHIVQNVANALPGRTPIEVSQYIRTDDLLMSALDKNHPITATQRKRYRTAYEDSLTRLPIESVRGIHSQVDPTLDGWVRTSQLAYAHLGPQLRKYDPWAYSVAVDSLGPIHDYKVPFEVKAVGVGGDRALELSATWSLNLWERAEANPKLARALDQVDSVMVHTAGGTRLGAASEATLTFDVEGIEKSSLTWQEVADHEMAHIISVDVLQQNRKKWGALSDDLALLRLLAATKTLKGPLSNVNWEYINNSSTSRWRGLSEATAELLRNYSYDPTLTDALRGVGADGWADFLETF